jgi:methionine biosynthesis protein MetW
MGQYFHNRRMELFRQLPVVIADLISSVQGNGTNLLDVGCWDGEFTVKYAEALGTKVTESHGIDFFPSILETAKKRGVQAIRLDLEKDLFPFPDQSFDVVVCNQVLEHLKQIYLPLTEMHRVLKPGGHLVISVPNLAAFHNRLLLAVGLQPATIKIMGPHVRSYTLRAFTEFLEFNDLFDLQRVVPVGMYPFPVQMGSAFCRLTPSLCHTPVWLMRKTSTNAESWFDLMKRKGEQTTFFD